ncbi:M15 family metallopeptidase [Streptomyces lasiicapitis]|uniref:M15 family metallopeptidase n=1 Tax=Streptomyces lasiicapitis TaxID=1923961 RepID=UPI0016693D5B|nr:M15 family metallopeptidase [Streptomyces lasiicapitis]
MTRTPSSSARTTTHRARWLLFVGLTAVIAVIIVALTHQSQKASSSASGPPSSAGPPSHSGQGDRRGALGEDDSVVPDGVTVFNDAIPGVTKLDPGLLKALRQAATAAADDGVEFYVNSGRRSPEYQDRLLREAVSKYGSEDEAARWVATASTSPHVSGDAVDIGRTDATEWLSEHGAEYGLCQIYRNEPWHYELRTEAIDRDCPRMYADPTEDPRMQQ